MKSPSTREVRIGSARCGGGAPPLVVAGPCVVESEEGVLQTATALRDICRRLGLALVFKSSYDKANRSSLSSFRGPGLERGLRVLQDVKSKTGLPVLSDVHSPQEVGPASEVLDALQVPAFLCRQTDLILAAAETALPVNIKKGQFMAPWDMANVVEKFTSRGNHNLLLTERGVSFGYNNLVVDMRSLPIMRSLGYPVLFDATHSVQLPGGLGRASGGQRQFVAPLARAAVAAGLDGIFLEVHPRPQEALCDGPNMLPLEEVEEVLQSLKSIWEVSRGYY